MPEIRIVEVDHNKTGPNFALQDYMGEQGTALQGFDAPGRPFVLAAVEAAPGEPIAADLSSHTILGVAACTLSYRSGNVPRVAVTQAVVSSETGDIPPAEITERLGEALFHREAERTPKNVPLNESRSALLVRRVGAFARLEAGQSGV